MIENAKKAFGEELAENMVYTRRPLDSSDWIVDANMEGMSSTAMIYRDGKWLYRDTSDSGSDAYDRNGERPMEGGFEEAMSNAGIFFTG